MRARLRDLENDMNAEHQQQQNHGSSLGSTMVDTFPSLEESKLEFRNRQTGESCRALERHIYWTEFAPDRHQFFKLMMENFRNELRIPTKFVNHFKEKMLGTVRLIGPSRNVWDVKIEETDDDVVFQIGWEKFVQDHSLSERDFVVFQYIGFSSFNVSIFDQTGCEREGAFFVKKHFSCTRNACFLEDEEEEILQITDGEEMKGKAKKEKLKVRDGAIGKVRERNLRSKTSMLVGTSFKANNSNKTLKLLVLGKKTCGRRKGQNPSPINLSKLNEYGGY